MISGAIWAGHLRSVRRAASYDALTGLPNRALLADRIRTAVHDDQPATVFVLDLERFREVNDLLGHHHGDLLLNQVAERLMAAAPGATVARLGGDDFALLVPGDVDADSVAERVLAVFDSAFVVEGLNIDLDVGLGAARSPDHGGDATTLLRHADTAMREAKQDYSGYQMYDPDTEQHVPNRLALLGDLRRALDAGDQITLHYQPKIDLRTGDLAGVEALVRWNHPELGRMAPDTFIPIAETTSLIHTLTTTVLEMAVDQATIWLAQGRRIPVAVNLSTRCLLDRALPGRILDLLRRTGLPVSLLELEITESMGMADPGRAVATLGELHEAGIRLSVDDFGTGHSSMAYLQRLPVDELKIDRSFVHDIAANEANAVLVRTAISLGHNLGLSVVAEGVEIEDDVSALQALGCDTAQGYHFARPMPAADLLAWYATWSTTRARTDRGAGLAHHG
jgi:diguanylate cyclase (GGDEF)-like protein